MSGIVGRREADGQEICSGTLPQVFILQRLQRHLFGEGVSVRRVSQLAESISRSTGQIIREGRFFLMGELQLVRLIICRAGRILIKGQ
ncbi:hypothetical protein D9M69_734380 [compost metagenome]